MSRAGPRQTSQVTDHSGDASIRLFRRGVLRWHGRHTRAFPWRSEEDPYRVLIGEVLLQRTRGEHVADVYREFLRRWPTPASLSRARLTTIQRVISPLGLPKRAPMLQRLGRELHALGVVPSRPDVLVSLPGVGPYVAHAVPIFAFNRKLPLVDWVIARVLRRYFGLTGESRPNADRELWTLATAIVEPGRAREVWLGTLDLAAAVCKATPLCAACPLLMSCRWAFDNGVSCREQLA